MECLAVHNYLLGQCIKCWSATASVQILLINEQTKYGRLGVLREIYAISNYGLYAENAQTGLNVNSYCSMEAVVVGNDKYVAPIISYLKRKTRFLKTF